jgi:hypothetical protein
VNRLLGLVVGPSCLCAVVVAGTSAVAQQQPSTRPGWPCVGRPDPSLVQVSEASGGQVFLLDSSEIASSATVLLARDGLDETLRRVLGDLEPGDRTFEIEVDGSVTRVLFSVSLQCLQAMEIVRPSGTAVSSAESGVRWAQFQAGRLITVDDPEPGRWQVRVAGKGLVSVVVSARSALMLESVRPVREGGRPGHEGLMRDDAPLVAGTTRRLEIRLSRGIAAPTFELRGGADERLGRIPVALVEDGGGEQVFLSEFRVPGIPFRLVVTARDETGGTVQRVQGSLFQLSHSR